MARSALRFRIPDDVAARIRKLHPELKQKVRAAFKAIAADTRVGKALEAELAGLRSLKVANHRIIYRTVAARTVEIVAVGPRDLIYEETARLLKGERS